MSDYQQEQRVSLLAVREHIGGMPDDERIDLLGAIRGYLEFRFEVDEFLTRNFSTICTEKCYRDNLSACCSRDGIITFFADHVVNVLVSEPLRLDDMAHVLNTPQTGSKCLYLGKSGCLWRIKPIVCEMFLCDEAIQKGFSESPEKKEQWLEFEKRRKGFLWPDRPVLFDFIEHLFIETGCQSPLMYFNNSPGLLRVKQKAGLHNPSTN